MERKLRFDVEENLGCFVYPDEQFAPLLGEFDNLLDTHQSGGINDNRYISELNRLIKLEPDFIDLHAHLSFIFLEQDKPKKALNAALKGLAVGNRLIPESFSGNIEWGYLENRPYLRALQGAILAYVRLHRHKDATTLIDKILAYNPNDNQGNRYLLGSEVLRAGDKKRAAIIFDEYADNYPPYCYEAALLHILNKDWVKAATALRLGFSANSYIAEILCGNFHPQPLTIWHGTNFAEPRIANNYIKMYGDLWFRYPESLAFVRWLFNHSSVLTERASLMKCSEGLLSERNFDARGQIIDRQRQLLNGIDHRLSEEIVKKISSRRGQEIWPWMHSFGWSSV
ncbi:tetratricopeptide repeat protein [Morganella morganii]|uniref:tetratricopeptide repeat protein n=1 Tax=Morganella morganii TaxID=582 RepID=UPI0023687AB1|nr:tetratricopeptide repeat protein [Morganella morganii]